MSLPKGDICPCSKEVYVLDPKTYMSLDERHICPWTKGVYLLERGGYPPLVESSGGFSRPFRRLFRNACGAAWISRRQALAIPPVRFPYPAQSRYAIIPVV